MLRSECYESGHGCTEEQLQYAEDYCRLHDVRKGLLRRRLFQLAATPKPQLSRVGDRVVCRPGRLQLDKPFVNHNSVDVLMLFDRPMTPRLRRKAELRELRADVEIVAMGVTGHSDESNGMPCIGGKFDATHAVYNFAIPPFKICQQNVVQHATCEDLVAPISGRLRVRSLGESVDLCVGKVGELLLVTHRLSVDDILGDNPKVRIAGAERLPEPGEIMLLHEVSAGEVIASVQEEIVLQRPIFNNGRTDIVRSRYRILPAARKLEFRVFNRMNRDQLQYAQEGRQTIDPAVWQWGAAYCFESVQSLVYSEQFLVTPAMRADLLAAIGPGGLLAADGTRQYLRLRSRDDHTLQQIVRRPETDSIELHFDSGQIQIVPGCADLFLLREAAVLPLKPGVKLTKGELIGDFCPRQLLTWVQARELFGSQLPLVVAEFLQSVAIVPGQYGWEGPGVLVDCRYTAPCAAQLALRDSNGEPAWYWDFRRPLAAQCFDAELGSLICPPMRYDDWDQYEFQLGPVTVMPAEQADIEEHNAAANSKRERRNRRTTTTEESATE